jgi:hypothetical protein
MRPGRDRLTWLALPVLVYTTGVTAAGLTTVNLPFVAGLLLAAAPLALLAVPDRGALLALLPFVALGIVLVGGITSGFLLAAPWDALLGGALCGLPLGVLGGLLGYSGEPSVRFLLLVAGLWEGLGLRAAGGSTPGAVGSSFLQVELRQIGGLGAWAGGAGSPIVPLASVNDPVFFGLALLALGGALLALLRIPEAAGAPRGYRESDLWLVALALGAGALFEVLALGVPRVALLGLALSVLLLVTAVLLLSTRTGRRWLTALTRRLRRGPLSSNSPD